MKSLPWEVDNWQRWLYKHRCPSSEVGAESSCDEILLLLHEEAECLGAGHLTRNKRQLEGKEHEAKRRSRWNCRKWRWKVTVQFVSCRCYETRIRSCARWVDECCCVWRGWQAWVSSFFPTRLVKRRNNIKPGSKGLKLRTCATKCHCSSCWDCRKKSAPGYLQPGR